jgi:hypothetical protein
MMAVRFEVLSKTRMCCVVKPDGISNGVVMDKCEEMAK